MNKNSGIEIWGEATFPVNFRGLNFSVDFTYSEIQRAIESGANAVILDYDNPFRNENYIKACKALQDSLQLPIINKACLADIDKVFEESIASGKKADFIILDSIPYASLEDIKKLQEELYVKKVLDKDYTKMSAKEIHESKLPNYVKLKGRGGRRWH